MRYPGIRILVLRRSYDELAESIYPEYRRFNWAETLGGKWNKTDKEITFPNGSLIRLRYMETSDDASRRQGGAYQLLLVDELTLMPPGVVSTIANERLRSAHGIPVLGLRASSNPGGASHGEVKSRYVDTTANGTKIYTDDNGLSIRFIKARATDNPYLDEAYYRRLDAIPDPARRAAMRDGDWGQFAGQMFCYDELMEILTASGWKLIPKVEVGERVATLAPDGTMTFEPVTGVWTYPYQGDMYVYQGRALDFSVTPGHSMWTHGMNSSPNFRFRLIEDLPKESVHLRAAARWKGESGTTVTIEAPGVRDNFQPVSGMCVICAKASPTRGRRGRCEPCYRVWVSLGKPDDMSLVRKLRNNGVTVNAWNKSYTFDRGDWCELLGWYLSEGFTCKASSGSRYAGRIYGFGIAQIDGKPEVEQIRNLLTRMGFKYTRDSRRFRVASRVLGAYFAQFGHHADKFIPREVLGWSTKHLTRLFDALIAGDGCRPRDDSDACLYSTTSRQLADDVQELAVRINRVATITVKAPANERSRTHYRVSVYRSGHERSVVNRTNLRREPYSGLVACVTVEPYHTVFVRRNGKAMWCGNSELRWERHTCDPVELPLAWKRYVGVDWGFAAPWAVVWAAIDPDGRVWMYREIYQAGVGEADQALKILASEDDHEYIAARWADDSMWNKLGDAKPIADVYAANGVALTPAGKSSVSRVHGWQRWHSYLAEAPACPMHRAHGWETCPKVHIFRTLPKLWWELSNLPHSSRGNPEDADTAAPDHLCDASRYLLINLGGEARFHFPSDRSGQDAVRVINPRAAGPASHEPAPLPAVIGGFPVLQGDDPWSGLLDR